MVVAANRRTLLVFLGTEQNKAEFHKVSSNSIENYINIDEVSSLNSRELILFAAGIDIGEAYTVGAECESRKTSK